jgi:hypothetical protein
VHSSSLPQLAALLALGDWTAFGFDLKEWTVGVVAGRSSVAFNARFAGEAGFVSEDLGE